MRFILKDKKLSDYGIKDITLKFGNGRTSNVCEARIYRNMSNKGLKLLYDKRNEELNAGKTNRGFSIRISEAIVELVSIDDEIKLREHKDYKEFSKNSDLYEELVAGPYWAQKKKKRRDSYVKTFFYDLKKFAIDLEKTDDLDLLIEIIDSLKHTKKQLKKLL